MKNIYSLILFVSLINFASSAQNSEWKTLKGDLDFIIANDLGRNGYYEQKSIAELMGNMAEEIGPEAVLALGDVHHFDGVQSTADPLWTSNYEMIYTHPELMIEWLPICGNHEYRGNTSAVLDYSQISRRWRISDYYYSKTFFDNGVSLKIIFLDTTPLIEKYRANTEKYPDACKQDAEKQLDWLENELQADTAMWTIVVGHHPIYAYTSKDDSERSDMQKKVDSILRRHNVDMYICGHIHNFQHYKVAGSAIDYIVNTSGSLSRAKVNKEAPGCVFASGEAGFSVLTVKEKTLSLSMVNSAGSIIHIVTRSK